jgi:hypothetical protein
MDLATKIESVLGSAYALSTSDALALLHVSVVGLTASLCANQQLLRVRPYDLDRIRTELPGTSVERFERSRRRFCSLRSAFRVTDVNSPLQALELVPVGAEQIFEEADVVRGHHTLHHLAISQLRRIPRQDIDLGQKGDNLHAAPTPGWSSRRRRGSGPMGVPGGLDPRPAVAGGRAAHSSAQRRVSCVTPPDPRSR